MDTMTPRYPDADLQASLRHLHRFLRVGAVALVLTGLSLSFAAPRRGRRREDRRRGDHRDRRPPGRRPTRR